MEAGFIRRGPLRGVGPGVGAWLSYGVVEYAFLALAPRLSETSYEYVGLHLGFAVVVLAVYAACGLLVDLLAGLAARSSERLAVLSVVVACGANLALTSIADPRSRAMLVVCAALAVALLFGGARGAAVANRWASSLILVGLPWLVFEMLARDDPPTRVAAGVGYLTIPLGLTLLARRLPRRGAGQGRWRRVRAPLVASLVVLGAGSFLHQQPHVLAPVADAGPGRQDRANVVLVILDTVRADHMSIYGYRRDTTPVLRGLRDQMVLYRHAAAPSDLTLSSHASLFTGLYAHRHGAHHTSTSAVGHALGKRFDTLAELLAADGYYTAGVAANYGYLSERFGLTQGFQYWDRRSQVIPMPELLPLYLRSALRQFAKTFAPRASYDMLYRRAGQITDEAAALLGRLANTDANFFLFLNYMDAHRPYIPPAPFDTLFPGKQDDFDSDRQRLLRQRVNSRRMELGAADREHLESQYDGGIAYIDQQLGRLVARLKELGLYDDCLLIVAADHGEAFGERQLMGHGVSVYEEQLHVPLLVKYPAAEGGGASVERPVSLIDVFPTILSVAGIEPPETIDARSLDGGRASAGGLVLGESFPWRVTAPWQERLDRTLQAVYDGTHKLVVSSKGEAKLFDLSTDPGETRDLYDQNPDLAQALGQRLAEWLLAFPSTDREDVRLDRRTLRNLGALGYLD